MKVIQRSCVTYDFLHITVCFYLLVKLAKYELSQSTNNFNNKYIQVLFFLNMTFKEKVIKESRSFKLEQCCLIDIHHSCFCSLNLILHLYHDMAFKFYDKKKKLGKNEKTENVIFPSTVYVLFNTWAYFILSYMWFKLIMLKLSGVQPLYSFLGNQCQRHEI